MEASQKLWASFSTLRSKLGCILVVGLSATHALAQTHWADKFPQRVMLPMTQSNAKQFTVSEIHRVNNSLLKQSFTAQSLPSPSCSVVESEDAQWRYLSLVCGHASGDSRASEYSAQILEILQLPLEQGRSNARLTRFYPNTFSNVKVPSLSESWLKALGLSARSQRSFENDTLNWICFDSVQTPMSDLRKELGRLAKMAGFSEKSGDLLAQQMGAKGMQWWQAPSRDIFIHLHESQGKTSFLISEQLRLNNRVPVKP